MSTGRFALVTLLVVFLALCSSVSVDAVPGVASACFDNGYRYSSATFRTLERSNRHECAISCEGDGACSFYTYTQSMCVIYKREADKSWGRTAVYQVPANGKGDCNRLCHENPECNDGVSFVPGKCELKRNKGKSLPVRSWYSVTSGPCDTGTPKNSAPAQGMHDGCDNGYERRGSLCYKIHFERRIFSEASRVCNEEGGHLVTPRNPQENAQVLEMFCNSDTGCRVPRGAVLDGVYFMGLHADTPGYHDNWKWVTGETYSYRNWGGRDQRPPLMYGGATTQPDNTSGEQTCTYFYPRDFPSGVPNGGWGDEDCNSKFLTPPGKEVPTARRFICQRAPAAGAPPAPKPNPGPKDVDHGVLGGEVSGCVQNRLEVMTDKFFGKKHVPWPNHKECERECAEQGECTVFVHVADGWCYLKGGKELSRNPNKAGVVAGWPGCPYKLSTIVTELNGLDTGGTSSDEPKIPSSALGQFTPPTFAFIALPLLLLSLVARR